MLARSAVDVAEAATRTGAEEEAIRVPIIHKRQRMKTRALAREQSRAVCAMARLRPKEEGYESDWADNSDKAETQLDPYCVFDRYFRYKDTKGSDKGKRG